MPTFCWNAHPIIRSSLHLFTSHGSPGVCTLLDFRGPIICAHISKVYCPRKIALVPVKKHWKSCNMNKWLVYYGPLARYIQLRVAYAPGTFPQPPRVSDPDMHHCTCATDVPWCTPGSLTSCFLRNAPSGWIQIGESRWEVARESRNTSSAFMTHPVTRWAKTMP